MDILLHIRDEDVKALEIVRLREASTLSLDEYIAMQVDRTILNPVRRRDLVNALDRLDPARRVQAYGEMYDVLTKYARVEPSP